jgi:hypothetical protein
VPIVSKKSRRSVRPSRLKIMRVMAAHTHLEILHTTHESCVGKFVPTAFTRKREHTRLQSPSLLLCVGTSPNSFTILHCRHISLPLHYYPCVPCHAICMHSL